MNRPEKKRTTSQRKDTYTMIMILTMIGVLIFRIPLAHLIGDKGVAYFGMANEIYFVIAGTVAFGLSEAVTVLVKYRVKREQFKSTRWVLNGALVTGGIIGAVFSIFFGAAGHFAAKNIMHMPLAGLAVTMMAPAMFFFILTNVLRGYFQGNGSRIPSIHSQILHLLFLFVGGLIGTVLLRGYGVKVSALLQNEDYARAYGAMGASIGFLSASVLCFLHVLILYLIYKSSLKKQMSREIQKNKDSGFHIVHMLLGTGVVYALYFFLFNALPLVDQYLVSLFGAAENDFASAWGAYYGKCLVLTGVIGGLIHMSCLGSVRRTVGYMDRQEYRTARERLGILIHQCAAAVIPSAVFLAVFAENILSLLYPSVDSQTVIWVQLSSVVLVFFTYTLVFMEIFIKSRKMKYAVLAGSGAMILHIGTLFFLLKTTKLGIIAVLISNIIFYAITAVVGFLLISRFYQYRQEWMKSFAVTIVDSCIAGVIAMLLNKVFTPMIGMTISLVICLLTVIVVYIILLVVTRAFRREELEEMPGGKILILLAGLFHIS